MLSHEDQYTTMSIASLGASTLPDQKPKEKRFAIKNTNDISDIEGARCEPKANKYSNKPAFLQSDVPGSTSKALTHSRNVRDLQLYIDDIDGTRHSIKDRMMRTTRHVNPLLPEYPLPSFIPVEPVEPKFMRDSMNIDDIDGTRSKPPKLYTMRDTISCNDIVGAQANFRARHEKARLEAPPHDPMWLVENNTKKKYTDRTNRVTNLMNPEYHINGMHYHDDPRYSKPKSLPKEIKDSHLLKTADIDGAYPGWGRHERREFRNLTSTLDIEGAQADTIKHSIVTTRMTNVLTPVYQSLDGDELYPLIKPVMPAHIITKPTLRPEKTNNSNVNTNSNSAASISNAPETSHLDSSEYDPVMFGKSDINLSASRSNSKNDLKLDLSAATHAVPLSGRGGSGRQAGFNQYDQLQPAIKSNVTFQNNSGRTLSGRSPAVSARSKLALSTSEKKAIRELNEEIDRVRKL
jgi:hypothetical protein